MKNCWLLIFLVILSPLFSKGQGDVHVFSTKKIRLIDYGERKQTETVSENRIVLDLRDSVIIVESNHSDITDFLNFNSRFTIVNAPGIRNDTRVYVTREGYIFSFSMKRMTILVGKEGMNINMHSLWFDQIRME